MRRTPALLLPLCGLLLAPIARAEPPVRRPAPERRAAPTRDAAEAEPRGEYAGVTPGLPRMPRVHLPRDAARTCYVTWMGFQLTPTGSRLFIQASQALTTQLSVTPGRLTVHLPGCRLASAKHARLLDLRYFATPLATARLVGSGAQGVSLVADLRQVATPTVTAHRMQGWHYAFVELRHAHVIPRDVERPAPRRPRRDARRHRRPAPVRPGPEQP